MATTSAITNVGQNMPQYTKTICQKLWQKHLPQYLDIMLSSILYGLTPAIMKHANIHVQYCKTHIYPYTIMGYNNPGKTFSSDQKKPRQRSGKCLSSNYILSSVLEKINLIHIENGMRNIHAQNIYIITPNNVFKI